jgi:hypothetical protein
VRVRAQGRDPALGLDCVGVVAVALAPAEAATALTRPALLPPNQRSTPPA